MTWAPVVHANSSPRIGGELHLIAEEMSHAGHSGYGQGMLVISGPKMIIFTYATYFYHGRDPAQRESLRFRICRQHPEDLSDLDGGSRDFFSFEAALSLRL